MANTPQQWKLAVSRQALRLLGMLSPALTASLALRLWYSTRRYRESEHDARWRRQAQLQMLEHEYGRIAVYRWGEDDRPVVLLLHGWNGRASQFATMLPALLKAGYQVLAFDAPGSGKSSGHSTNLIRIGAVLQSITAELPAIRAVISHSYGGIVAAYAIRQLALPAQKLVMIAPPVSNHELLVLFADSVGLSRRVLRNMETMIRRRFGEDAFERSSAESNLRGSKLPILLIHDRQDKAVSWHNSERIVEVAENATAIYTEGRGHRRLLRDRKLIRRIIAFINMGALPT